MLPLASFLTYLFLLNSSATWAFRPLHGAPHHVSIATTTRTCRKALSPRNDRSDPDDQTKNSYNRRRMFLALGTPLALLPMSYVTLSPLASWATDESGQATIWLSGKAPRVPGKKPTNDVSGSKKDPNFLRSISDCKNQCENSAGADGMSRSKEECLSECQDICCTTYEQCTFAIVPRI
jgi:hypothetical protein